MTNEQAIKEVQENIQWLEKRMEYHKDNESKVNAIENEIEVNQIALRALEGK